MTHRNVKYVFEPSGRSFFVELPSERTIDNPSIVRALIFEDASVSMGHEFEEGWHMSDDGTAKLTCAVCGRTATVDVDGQANDFLTGNEC